MKKKIKSKLIISNLIFATCKVDKPHKFIDLSTTF